MMLRKAAVVATMGCACLLLDGGGQVALPQTPPGDLLVGVTWSDGALVTFDPASGEILQRHMQIDSRGPVIALAYDRNHGRLHALAQADNALYTIDTDTLRIANVVTLRIDPRVPGLTEATSLAYDPTTDTLYTAVGHWEDYPVGPIWNELAKLDPWTGKLDILGRIEGPWMAGLTFNESDRSLYGLGAFAAGSWDSPDSTDVVRIDPATAALETVYVTPYHTMLGFALKEPGTFFSWINWTSHFFGRTDLPAQTITPLGSAEPSGPIGAMILKTFSLPPEPVPIPPSPVSFVFSGSVTEVSDPHGLLRGQIRAGHEFHGQFTYDAAAPFKPFDRGRDNLYGVSLHTRRISYYAPSYAASIGNDRFDFSDESLTDEFRLQGYAFSDVVISWTLIDPTGRAVDASDRLPEEFDLSRWATNIFSVARYDACCPNPVYVFVGRVDQVRRRQGPITRPLPNPWRRVRD